MTRWGSKQTHGFPEDPPEYTTEKTPAVTDDPLAAIDPSPGGQKIYSVTRVNPLFLESCVANFRCSEKEKKKSTPILGRISRQSTQQSGGGKSSSSGYGGSNHDPLYSDSVKLTEEGVAVLEQNSGFVKSIQVARQDKFGKRRSFASSSGGGTLTTIQEGKIDFCIPRPIWPKFVESKARQDYDSLLDEAVMLYTSLNYVPDGKHYSDASNKEVSVQEVLLELMKEISQTMEGNGSPEEMLKVINERISLSLEVLKNSTEDEMRKLCLNLSNSKKVSSVVRAFSNSSSSGNSSQSSKEWCQSDRIRTISSENEEIYQIPSGSSSSGFSDSVKAFESRLPVFIHEDLSCVPNGVRNAMIYGTLCRTSFKNGASEKLVESKGGQHPTVKKSLLRAPEGSKPSVWEQYYGVRAECVVNEHYVPKPTDIPLFPGGRPEADFTLDLPRSELLSKRMKADKKWRCRCRLFTSFLGLVFFLLSVMAVSLMLTRGKKMFGSMV